MSKSIESGVRKYLKYNLAHSIRRYFTLRGVFQGGKKIYVDSNVKILRHPERLKMKDGVVLKEGVRICPTNPKAYVEIGENTTVGYHTMIFATSSIVIGDNCLIAPFVYLVDSEHTITRDELINKQPMNPSSINIGADVWIGSGAKVLSGVSIGQGAVIAAGAVVNKDIEPYSIVGGVPCRVLGRRE